MCYICVQLYAYVTHMLSMRTTVCICNMWTIYVKLLYDMDVPDTYVTLVYYMMKRRKKQQKTTKKKQQKKQRFSLERHHPHLLPRWWAISYPRSPKLRP